MTPRNPSGQTLPHVLQLRLSPTQRAFLLFESVRTQKPQSQVVRDVIEAAIDARTIATGEEPDADEAPLRVVLDAVGADPEALAELVDQAPDAE